MFKIILTIFCFIFISACTHDDGRYAVISTKPLPLRSLLYNNVKVVEASAESSRHVAVIIPFSKAPSVSAAINAVLDQYHGDYLANAEIKQVSGQLMFWYHYKAWEVTGTVMRLNAG